MPLQAWMSIIGSVQGQFKSETTNQVRQSRWIPVLTYSFGVQSPFDAGKGMVTGRRVYSPITVVKQWGQASPQILAAAATGETLLTVEFEFERIAANNTPIVYQSIALINAILVGVNQSTANASSPQPATTEINLSELEQLQFLFQKIDVKNEDGGTQFLDNWAA